MPDDLTVSVELVRRAKAGDREALERLVQRYYPRVWNIVRLRLGPKLRERVDSQDILQETFIQAVLSFDHFEMRDEASLIKWLATLAERQINAAADYHGAQKRDRRREVALPAVQPSANTTRLQFDVSATVSGPLDKIAASEEMHVVEECIRALPEEYRELIEWRDYANAGWEEIARHTKRPSAAAARVMHARAMVELGKLVRGRGLK